MKNTNTKSNTEYKTSEFHKLIEEYNQTQSESSLIALATACTYSVLNKVYSASGNANILRVKAQVASGEDVTLIDTAVVAILEEYSKQVERNEKIDLEAPYETRVLNKKIYIQEDPSDCYKTITTTPIQEVYKAIRREIDNAGHGKADTNGYSYISLSVHDDVSGLDEIVYKRYGKYADIGGYAKDFNGAETVYTADEHVADDIDNLLAKLNLTSRQAQVMKYRLQGYGAKAIGTKLGVSYQAIQCTMKAIQAKAEAIGLTLDK